MKTLIITEEILNSLSESAKAELSAIENKKVSMQKQCKDLIASFNYDKIEHRTDTGEKYFDIIPKRTSTPGILRVDRWHKTAGEQWGNCAGTYLVVESIGRKYVKLEAEHFRTNERDWTEYKTIDIELFLSFLMDWKIAEDCEESADQDVLIRKLSAKIANWFN
jgi:hypothetical protein